DAINDRIADEFAQMEPELVELAAEMTFDRWRQRVRFVAALLDQDGGYNPNNDPAANRLYIGTLYGGTTEIRATLHGELALIVKSVLTAHTDHLRRRYQTDHDTTNGDIDIPDTAQLAA
ncbi:MAG TPA: HNH endonuclease, partial [Microthrixaceae bacterium]|nr:HNH endonuclease [Microthrixaceae bacterium]